MPAKEKKVKKLEVKKALFKPRVTEKAALSQASRSVYVFNVEKDATQKSIASILKKDHKVTPIKINFAAIPTKTKMFRGKKGTKGGGKKAYVYLKKGDILAI